VKWQLKRMGMLGVSIKKMEVMTVKGTVTLIDKREIEYYMLCVLLSA
jgi:hypothetical protein